MKVMEDLPRPPVTDSNRVNAALAGPRLLSSEKMGCLHSYYRLIPRDTIQWHERFRNKQAMMRSGQFRSASGNSHVAFAVLRRRVRRKVLLRAIIYLYIYRRRNGKPRPVR